MARTEYIMIKVSDKEKEMIKKKAEKEGLTISAYIRYKIINGR